MTAGKLSPQGRRGRYLVNSLAIEVNTMTCTQVNIPWTFGTDVTTRFVVLTKLLFVLTFLLLFVPTFAQDSSRGGVQLSTNDWGRVQAIPLQSRIRVVGDKKKATCFVDAVTADQLSCSGSRGRKGTQMEYSREEIKEIKLTRRARSGAAGAAIGFAVGAGLGAAVGTGLNGTITYGKTTASKAAGAGAAVGGVGLGLVGGALGYGLDMFAGPVIYQRPHS